MRTRTARQNPYELIVDKMGQAMEAVVWMSMEAKAELNREGATPQQVALMEDQILTFYSGAAAGYAKLAKVWEYISTGDAHAAHRQLVALHGLLAEMRPMVSPVISSLPPKWTQPTSDVLDRLEKQYAIVLTNYNKMIASPPRSRY